MASANGKRENGLPHRNRQTAIHDHGVAGDLRSGIGGQPQRRFGRLLRAANPAGRDHLRVASGHFGPALVLAPADAVHAVLEHRGLEGARHLA